jgi:hypothetical protein
MTSGSTDDRPRRAMRQRLAAVPVLVVFAVLLSACSGTEAAPPENKAEKTSERATTKASSEPVPTFSGPRYTVEQLATKLGCTATFRGRTKGFRQGSCTKDGEEIVLLDFESAKDQYVWLDDAIGFGGIYLVGNGWGLSGVSEEWMAAQSKTLGGTVEDRDSWDS